VWAALLDEGVYLASVSTMYRELRRREQVRERRAQARHEAKKKPYLAAHAPNEIWSWDITKLQGPGRRQFYDLYVMLDIFSRYVVHWEVHLRESGELAERFMQNAFAVNGGIVPGTIHSDNGTSMTSKPVTALLADLDIIKSHSRPKVSNDNPYSEAQFKTLKYCPVSRTSSIRSTRPRRSAIISSITTITGITTRGSGCTRRSPSTSAPPRRSSTSEPPRSRRSVRPTRDGSPKGPHCPRSPRSHGSTDPTKTPSAKPTLIRRNTPPNDHWSLSRLT
jgi:integrase-like protein